MADETEYALTMVDERLEQAIAETAARLVILDSIQAYLGADINMNSVEINDVQETARRLEKSASSFAFDGKLSATSLRFTARQYCKNSKTMI